MTPKLQAKRDEQARAQAKMAEILGYTEDPHAVDFADGFDYCAAELLPLLEEMREALKFYATLKDRKYDEPGLRREFGCGCCCGVNDAEGDTDYDKTIAGSTAREALAKCAEVMGNE